MPINSKSGRRCFGFFMFVKLWIANMSCPKDTYLIMKVGTHNQLPSIL